MLATVNEFSLCGFDELVLVWPQPFELPSVGVPYKRSYILPVYLFWSLRQTNFLTKLRLSSKERKEEKKFISIEKCMVKQRTENTYLWFTDPLL